MAAGRPKLLIRFKVKDQITNYLNARRRSVPVARYKKAVNKGVLTVKKYLHKHIPVRTGAMASSIRVEKAQVSNAPFPGWNRLLMTKAATGATMGVFGNITAVLGKLKVESEIAEYVHEGTGVYVGHSGWYPPPYYGKNGLQYIYTIGQKPNPFLTKSVNQAKRAVETLFMYTLAQRMW